MNKFRQFCLQVSKNNSKTAWVLKGDIRKCFASVDQDILLSILRRYIPDEDIVWLLDNIITSFHSGVFGAGLPLGNLTSQLFINIYLNGFDRFVKHRLRVRHYIRYADDFVIVSEDRNWLLSLLLEMNTFLRGELHFTLHPDKIILKTIYSGVDFLGWVHFPHYRVLRNKTKQRMMRGIKERPVNEVLQSYLGLLQHGDGYGIQREVRQRYWLWRS